MGYYNSQIAIKQEQIDKLSWILEGYQYLSRHDNVVNNGIMYSISGDTYDKLEYRLKGRDIDNIKAKDKVYIMPGSKIPMFKLKDHLRNIGASLVSDVNKATFFIGTGKISEDGYQQAKQTSLIFSDRTPEITGDIEKLYEELEDKNITTTIKTDSYRSLENSFIDNYNTFYISHSISIPDRNWMSYPSKMFFITPIGCMIIYNSILKKIPIVSEDVVLDQFAPVSVIDEDMYISITSMFDSKDHSNHDVARELIYNCDIKKSLFYLWKLGRRFNNYITDSRMKNLRLFIERAEWNELHGMSSEEFIEYLYQGDYLTPEMFRELMYDATKAYTDKLNSSVFKMILVPSDKYKEYANSTDKFEFHHKDESKVRGQIETLIEEEDANF